MPDEGRQAVLAGHACALELVGPHADQLRDVCPSSGIWTSIMAGTRWRAGTTAELLGCEWGIEQWVAFAGFNLGFKEFVVSAAEHYVQRGKAKAEMWTGDSTATPRLMPAVSLGRGRGSPTGR